MLIENNQDLSVVSQSRWKWQQQPRVRQIAYRSMSAVQLWDDERLPGRWQLAPYIAKSENQLILPFHYLVSSCFYQFLTVSSFMTPAQCSDRSEGILDTVICRRLCLKKERKQEQSMWLVEHLLLWGAWLGLEERSSLYLTEMTPQRYRLACDLICVALRQTVQICVCLYYQLCFTWSTKAVKQLQGDPARRTHAPLAERKHCELLLWDTSKVEYMGCQTER